jgi:hypothetical protein
LLIVRRKLNDDELTRINIHALSGIRTHSLSIQAIKNYATDLAATGTGPPDKDISCVVNAVFQYLCKHSGAENSITALLLTLH